MSFVVKKICCTVFSVRSQDPLQGKAGKTLIEGHPKAGKRGGKETKVASVKGQLTDAAGRLFAFSGGHICQKQVQAEDWGGQYG